MTQNSTIPAAGARSPFTSLVAALALLLAGAACEGEREATPATGGDVVEVETPVDAETRARAMAVLARADAADGVVDHVVEKCSGCNLHMSGSADRTVEVLGYELHQCSASCEQRFEKAPVESVLAMQVDD